jgi:arylsulfatase A-like enzyme
MAGLRGRLLPPILVILAVAGALGAAGSGTPPAGIGQAAPAQARPNIVVIQTDDQTVESMRVMNRVNSLIGVPGATFRNSFVNFSQCCPSRATFLTGQYMHNHRVFGNTPPNGGFDRFQALHGSNNLAVWLHRAGYYTGAIGKYLGGYANRPLVPPGWSEWRVAVEDEQKVYDYNLNENGAQVHYGLAPKAFKQDVLTAKAVNFVTRRAPPARPFFLWLAYTAPHQAPDPNPNPPANCQESAKPAPRHAHAFDSEPLPRPPNFNETDVSDKPAPIRRLGRMTADRIADVQRWYRCRLESILSVDEGVGKIVDALRGKGELADTLVVFTSDNGYFHGEHRIPWAKGRIYEESIRVPLLMRGPGIPRGVKVSDLVVNADLAPTILDVANASAGVAIDGRSLVPVAQRPGIERGRGLLVEGPRISANHPPFKAVRTQRYMYAEYATGERELYDLNRDPFELESRHEDPAYAGVRNKLAGRLDALRTCAGASCRARP